MADDAVTPDAALERVRALALALPGAAERTSHGAPGFHIESGRFFAYFWGDNRDGETAVVVKTSGAEEQAMLLEMDPDSYFRPPYLGPSGWVAIRLLRSKTDWDGVSDRIAISWELVAPRRLLEAGGR